MTKQTKQNKNEYKGFKNFKKTLVFYKKYKLDLVLVAAFTLIGSAAYLFVPIFTAELITAITELAIDTAFVAILKVTAFGVLGQIMFLLYARFAVKVSLKVKKDMRYFLVGKAMDLRVADFDRKGTGFFVARFIEDAERISKVLSESIVEISWSLAQAGFIIYIYFMNVYMGLFMTAMVVVLFVCNTIQRRVVNRLQTASKRQNDIVTSGFNEVLRGVRDIKVLGIKLPILNRMDGMQTKSFQAEAKADVAESTVFRLTEALKVFLELGFVSLGLFLALNGLLLPAILIITILYKDSIMWMVQSVSEVLTKLTKAEVAAKRLYEVLDGNKGYEYEKFGNKAAKVTRGQIEFCNVNFNYGENKLFKNLSFKVAPNTTVAIVGKSGEGKTTIFNMLTRAYPHSVGQILLDGTPIEEFNEPSLRGAISGISQRPYIFDDTFAGNLRLVKPMATMEEIEKVCKMAHIHDFIITQPNGYETVVGENGITLSGGQAQRLAIARVLLSGAKVMLMDEATSSLDNESQGKVQRALEELQGEATILIIAHRLSTIVNCDKILVISGGKIVAEGTHTELKETCKEYQELYAGEEL
ncbi:MAG: ABC transporter ATP-binding protein/permease [Firmicutes bacterium]|nr:ABC transporter ATP-binding protein/permease [Bacillota bacterium]